MSSHTLRGRVAHHEVVAQLSRSQERAIFAKKAESGEAAGSMGAMHGMVYARAAKTLHEKGGFTVHLSGKETPTSGWMVSRNGTERVLPEKAATPHAIRSYAKEHHQTLADPHNFLGGWKNDGHVYLDISQHFNSEAEATHAGLERKQLAIYNLGTGEEKRLDLKPIAQLSRSQERAIFAKKAAGGEAAGGAGDMQVMEGMKHMSPVNTAFGPGSHVGGSDEKRQEHLARADEHFRQSEVHRTAALEAEHKGDFAAEAEHEQKWADEFSANVHERHLANGVDDSVGDPIRLAHGHVEGADHGPPVKPHAVNAPYTPDVPPPNIPGMSPGEHHYEVEGDSVVEKLNGTEVRRYPISEDRTPGELYIGKLHEGFVHVSSDGTSMGNGTSAITERTAAESTDATRAAEADAGYAHLKGVKDGAGTPGLPPGKTPAGDAARAQLEGYAAAQGIEINLTEMPIERQIWPEPSPSWESTDIHQVEHLPHGVYNSYQPDGNIEHVVFMDAKLYHSDAGTYLLTKDIAAIANAQYDGGYENSKLDALAKDGTKSQRNYHTLFRGVQEKNARPDDIRSATGGYILAHHLGWDTSSYAAADIKSASGSLSHDAVEEQMRLSKEAIQPKLKEVDSFLTDTTRKDGLVADTALYPWNSMYQDTIPPQLYFANKAYYDKMMVNWPQTQKDAYVKAQEAKLHDHTMITPVATGYVRGHFPAPAINHDTWHLSVQGEVKTKTRFDYNTVMGREPKKTEKSTLECFGYHRSVLVKPKGVKDFQYGAVSTSNFEGVPLRHYLMHAGLDKNADYVQMEGADFGTTERGATMRFIKPLDMHTALKSDTIVATKQNGEPLTQNHGAPARLVVPHYHSMAEIKFLTTVRARSSTTNIQADMKRRQGLKTRVTTHKDHSHEIVAQFNSNSRLRAIFAKEAEGGQAAGASGTMHTMEAMNSHQRAAQSLGEKFDANLRARQVVELKAEAQKHGGGLHTIATEDMAQRMIDRRVEERQAERVKIAGDMKKERAKARKAAKEAKAHREGKYIRSESGRMISPEEQALSRGTISGPYKNLSNGVNKVYRGKLSVEGEPDGFAVVKPDHGLTPEHIHPAIPLHTDNERSVASFLVNEHMGKLVDTPPAIVRTTTDHGKAEVQVLVTNINEYASMHDIPEREKVNAAVFDYLTGQMDRHHNNYLITDVGKKKHLVPIDNGYTFPVGSHDPKWHGNIWNKDFTYWGGDRELPTEAKGHLEQLIANRANVEHDLHPLVGQEATDQMFERAQWMLDHNRVPATFDEMKIVKPNSPHSALLAGGETTRGAARDLLAEYHTSNYRSAFGGTATFNKAVESHKAGFVEERARQERKNAREAKVQEHRAAKDAQVEHDAAKGATAEAQRRIDENFAHNGLSVMYKQASPTERDNLLLHEKERVIEERVQAHREAQFLHDVNRGDAERERQGRAIKDFVRENPHGGTRTDDAFGLSEAKRRLDAQGSTDRLRNINVEKNRLDYQRATQPIRTHHAEARYIDAERNNIARAVHDERAQQAVVNHQQQLSEMLANDSRNASDVRRRFDELSFPEQGRYNRAARDHALANGNVYPNGEHYRKGDHEALYRAGHYLFAKDMAQEGSQATGRVVAKHGEKLYGEPLKIRERYFAKGGHNIINAKKVYAKDVAAGKDLNLTPRSKPQSVGSRIRSLMPPDHGYNANHRAAARLALRAHKKSGEATPMPGATLLGEKGRPTKHVLPERALAYIGKYGEFERGDYMRKRRREGKTV